MNLSIVGDSHAANTVIYAGGNKGCILCSTAIAPLVLIAQDTPVLNDTGARDTAPIRELIMETYAMMKEGATLLVSSQVPPGFTRSLGIPVYHMAETLRIKDAEERALNPEQIVIGCANPDYVLPKALLDYLVIFNCPVWKLTYEEAEFSKIAINMTLASQVENTNRLSAAAAKIGADWANIVPVLRHDKRIGKHSYLQPGRWQDSKHLYRDYVTLKEIENG